MAERSQTTHIYDSSGQIDSTGSSNAYVIRVAEQISAYHRGMAPIRFKANFGNTGSATANIATELAPSGLGAVTMKKGGGASDLASGDIVSGGVYTLIYDGTFFQVLEQNATGFTLADGSVTNAKLADMAQLTIKARKTLSTGTPEDCTLSEVLDFVTSAAQGDILYRGAATWTRLGAGTSGHFLQTQGTGANPQWAAPSSGLTLLTSGTVTNQATLDIVLTGYTAYRGLMILLSSFVPVTDDVELWMRVSTDGGANYDATGYSFAFIRSRDGSTDAASVVSSSANQILIAGTTSASEAVSNVANENGAFVEIMLMNQTAAAFPRVNFKAGWFSANQQTFQGTGSGARENAQDTNAVRFLFESGNIASGNYAVYGLA